MEINGLFISASITMFSLGLLALTLIAFKKMKNTKLLFISLVFCVFLTKGILFSLSVFYQQLQVLDTILYTIYSGLFDVLILILLFIATFKR